MQLLRQSFENNEAITREALTLEEAQNLSNILDKLIANINKN